MGTHVSVYTMHTTQPFAPSRIFSRLMTDSRIRARRGIALVVEYICCLVEVQRAVIGLGSHRYTDEISSVPASTSPLALTNSARHSRYVDIEEFRPMHVAMHFRSIPKVSEAARLRRSGHAFKSHE